MKKCSKCEKVLKLSNFPIENSNTGKLNAKCRECKRSYDREYWDKTKEKRNEKKKINNKKRIIRNRQYIWDYLKNNPCVDCPESDPIVLEFDHLRDKKYGVSDMAGFSSISAIKKEIDKCEVRCANCHRRKTHKQLNHFNGNIESVV